MILYNNDKISANARAPLSQAEINSLYEYVERRNEDEQGFLLSIVTMYERNARWSNPIISLAVRAFGFLVKPKNDAIKYFFWGTKFKEIILGLPRHQVCVIGGPKQLFFCLKHRIPYLENMRLWGLLAQGLRDRYKVHIRQTLAKYIEEDGRKIGNKAKHGAILIVDNDSMPMQRAMILSGRCVGLRCVCIQDGVFQSKSPGHIMHGWFADQFLVFNEHQKTTLVAKGMDVKKIRIMGFHSSPYSPRRPTASPGQRRVCFLGQPWAKYGIERANRYMEIVNKTSAILQSAGINMTYKPHPWEFGLSHLSKVKNVVDFSLDKAFESYDVFISLTSTALIEAQAAGRVAIQLRDNQFDADDFSSHGQIVSVDLNLGEHWSEDLLSALDSPASLPGHNYPPARKFAETIEGES